MFKTTGFEKNEGTNLLVSAWRGPHDGGSGGSRRLARASGLVSRPGSGLTGGLALFLFDFRRGAYDSSSNVVELKSNHGRRNRTQHIVDTDC